MGMARSGPIDSTSERFSHLPDRVFNLELRTFRNRDVLGQEFKPNAGAIDATYATVINFPDTDMEVSGAHRLSACGQRRALATEAEKNKIAGDRARREMRRTAKWFVLDHMWTVTYRGPQRDREKAQRDIHRWERIVRQTYPQFQSVGVFEIHTGGGVNDGGYHYHCGVHGFYDVEVLRAAWWKVVGQAQGNVQVESRCSQSPASVSAYLVKYISKGDEMTGRKKKQHRYRRSQGMKLTRYKLKLGAGRALEREQQIKEWIKAVTGKDVVYEWHSDDGLQFMFRTFR
jgi:hypothetical protein